MSLARRWALLGGALGLAGLGGCFDFGAAYDGYCATVDGGCSGDGGTRRFDAGLDAGGGDSGTTDAGSDAGPQPCGKFGAGCNGPGQCCDDGGIQSVACGPGNVCESRPASCLPEGFFCNQSSECCDLLCLSGKCGGCGTAASGTACQTAKDCCIFNNAQCSAGNQCIAVQHPNTGAHCASSDFCDTSWCQPVADGGSDGICANAGTSCTVLNSQPHPGPPCCAGLTLLCTAAGQPCTSDSNCCSGSCDSSGTQNCNPGPQDGGICCLPNGSTCTNTSSCCSNSCIDGVCTTSKTLEDLGANCVQEVDCRAGLTCDFIGGICENRLCFPQQIAPGWGGCCTLESDGVTCDITDGGGRCLIGGASCSPSAPQGCCSGNCISVSTFFGTFTYCASITYP